MNTDAVTRERWIATVVVAEDETRDVLVTLTKFPPKPGLPTPWEAIVSTNTTDEHKAWGLTPRYALMSVVELSKLPDGLVTRWRRDGVPSDETLRVTMIAQHAALEAVAEFVRLSPRCDRADCVTCPENNAKRDRFEAALKLVSVTA